MPAEQGKPVTSARKLPPLHKQPVYSTGSQSHHLIAPSLKCFGGFWCLVSAVDFFGLFSLGKTAPKNPRFSTGEIQKGTGGRGRDRKCHKLSWRLSQIVVTFYDDLWRFMTFYDVLCQWNTETEIVIKCRKLSWHVVNCRDVCRKIFKDFGVWFPRFGLPQRGV